MALPLSKLQTLFSNKIIFSSFLIGICIVSLFIKIQIAKNAVAFADYDEYYTVKVAFGTFEGALPNHSISNIWRNASIDNGNNVLYNFILILWVNLFGKQEIMIRLLSLVFHFAGVLLCIKIFRNYKTPNHLVLLAIIALNFHPTIHQFSIVTRAYSLLMFESVLLFYLCYCKKDSSFKQALLIAITIILLVLTHYLAIPFILALFLEKIISGKSKKILSLELLPFWIAGAILIIYFSSNLNWFISIAEKNASIQQNAQTQSSQRHLSIDSFLSRILEFFATMFCGAGYLQRLASGIFPKIGGVVFNLFNVIFLIAFLIKSGWSKSNWIILGIGTAFPISMVLLSGHLTGFSLKYSIAFVAIYWILLFKSNVHSKFSYLFFACIFVNIAVNISVQLAFQNHPRMEVIIHGEKRLFNQNEIADLREVVLHQNQTAGFISYQFAEESSLIKTLMIETPVTLKKDSVSFISPPLLK